VIVIFGGGPNHTLVGLFLKCGLGVGVLKIFSNGLLREDTGVGGMATQGLPTALGIGWITSLGNLSVGT
jgi:hypothetical protein